MKERDKVIFFDISAIMDTVGIKQRCNKEYLTNELNKIFPDEKLSIKTVKIFTDGKYRRQMTVIKNLPDFCEIILLHSTGNHDEKITVWVPLKWNNRFIGTGGGGTATGGNNYIVKPDNTERGMTLPKAVINGFASAMTDAGCSKWVWAIDKRGNLDWELIENWNKRSTHFMTVIGKAVAEILHQRKTEFSYFHGGSGGGRQAMVEAMYYPEDYNGIWASCPAVNWTKLLPSGLWPVAVMNSKKNYLSADKMEFFTSAAQATVGGKEVYYAFDKAISFDPFSVVGKKAKSGIITTKDAGTYKEIIDGPHDSEGNRLYYSQRAGVLNWNKVIPIGAFYYTAFRKIPKPFFLTTFYLRWVTQNPKEDFSKATKEDFCRLFSESIIKFASCNADKTDLSAFMNAGGRLIIDHGIDDPIIPVDGTIDYYGKMCEAVGGKETADKFCRLYITPGDGHGNCKWHGPGITESDGMNALIDWIENNNSPTEIRTVLVSKKNGETIKENKQYAL